MIWTLITLLAVGGGPDPRIEIINAQLAGDLKTALTLTDKLLRSQPEHAQALGFDYLRGDLLEKLGRRREADTAFVSAMSSSPRLAAHGRYRLALNQSRSGHPEVAAGLLASLLASDPPQPLAERAARLLADALARGGDCRLLGKMSSWSLSGEPRRLVELSAIDCLLAEEPSDEAMTRLLRVLQETIVDEPARLAAERLHRHFSTRLERRNDLLLVGRVHHHQRQFELARSYLSRGLAAPEASERDPKIAAEARYELARSHFWQADYLDAVSEFGRVAEMAQRTEDAAGALYQQGRSYELYGSWEAAANSFRQSYLEDSSGRWAAPALMSTMRLEWRHGSESEALTIYDVLGSRRSWAELHGRAALFLASSDLVQNRADRAGAWLDRAQRASRRLAEATSYWSGRLEELQGNPRNAAEHYLEVIAGSPFHPLAEISRSHLKGPTLETVARSMGQDLARARDANSLLRAWVLLGEDPLGESSLDRLINRLRGLQGVESFLGLEFIAPEAWPLWDSALRDPEDILVSLGLWKEAQTAVIEHFPTSSVSLAYTANRLLARADAHRSALRHAEILHEAALARLPAPLVPTPLRRAVFPLPFGPDIARAAANHGVDPYLMTALIREESRFDTEAVSSASARGLTQFVLPTAQRLASRAGFERVTAEDLHRPRVAITLGATYLEELLERFEGRDFPAVAAYNAGESQAELWLSYCFSSDPAEYFTKVGFPETRSYLEKVFGSRAQYRDLYRPETFAASG